jgi:hypothetical protein
MFKVYANSHCVTFLRDGQTSQTYDAKINNSHLTGIVIMNTLLFITIFGLWAYWHCGLCWPVVPASGDSEDDCAEADGM